MSNGSAGHRSSWRTSLSFKLFGLTVGVILFTELLIFIPSAKGERDNWLDQRAHTSRIAALTLYSAPLVTVANNLSEELYRDSNVLAVAEFGDGIRESILLPYAEIDGPNMRTVDLRDEGFFKGLLETHRTVFSDKNESLRVLADGVRDGKTLEIIVDQSELRKALVYFSARIVGLSLLISGTAGALVFLGFFFLVVKPVRDVTRSLEEFAADPGGWKAQGAAGEFRDNEIGRAKEALLEMETIVSQAFRERARLAQLGEAVAKINHDMRNSLAAAQLVSDGLSRSEDPRVQKTLPRLERALERAIRLSQETLQFGKAKDQTPEFEDINLFEAVDEAAREGLAAGSSKTLWVNHIPTTLTARLDPDFIHRIVTNLVRNAAQVLEQSDTGGEISARIEDEKLLISDTGPGIAEQVQAGLFKAFGGSTKRDGSGLGLAIARELARDMGGDLSLERTGPDGTVFAVRLPE